MALRDRSISFPIVLASVAVALSIALLVGWTLIFSRYIVLTQSAAGGVSFLVLGIVSFVIVMAVLIVIAVFLVIEILNSRKQYRFMDSVTHELKSPLASMRLSAQTMANPRVNDEQREKLRRMILADVDRLTNVIDDILAAGRLDSRIRKMEWGDINLAAMVDDTIESVARRYDTDDDNIVNDVPESVILRTDRGAFAILISNLIDNAVKYSDSPRLVRVLLYRGRSNYIHLCVQDNGIGISFVELQRVRRRFYRSAHEKVRQRHGTGLGLYVVQGMARRMGIRLHIVSDGVDKGTTTILRIPVKYLDGVPNDLPMWEKAEK